ncbi:MAG: hypothetical protein ACLS9K_15865 [Lachnospira eligens]
MGKIILCRGQRTDKPYVTPQTDIKLYSAEELCYYIYNNIYLIGQDLIDDNQSRGWGEGELAARAELRTGFACTDTCDYS